MNKFKEKFKEKYKYEYELWKIFKEEMLIKRYKDHNVIRRIMIPIECLWLIFIVFIGVADQYSIPILSDICSWTFLFTAFLIWFILLNIDTKADEILARYSLLKEGSNDTMSDLMRNLINIMLYILRDNLWMIVIIVLLNLASGVVSMIAEPKFK